MGKTLSKEPTEPLSHGVNEHIRNDGKLNRTRRYIQENSARWAEDSENPANWQARKGAAIVNPE